MQEIKFRVWDGKKQMYYISDEYVSEALFKSKNSSHILMQYTGLKDKNGKEIYEGDICKGCITNTDKIFVIEKRIDPEFIGFIPVEVNTNSISFFQRWDCLEIIGNIYSDPHLLDK